jgi:hypothetical protein
MLSFANMSSVLSDFKMNCNICKLQKIDLFSRLGDVTFTSAAILLTRDDLQKGKCEYNWSPLYKPVRLNCFLCKINNFSFI